MRKLDPLWKDEDLDNNTDLYIKDVPINDANRLLFHKLVKKRTSSRCSSVPVPCIMSQHVEDSVNLAVKTPVPVDQDEQMCRKISTVSAMASEVFSERLSEKEPLTNSN